MQQSMHLIVFFALTAISNACSWCAEPNIVECGATDSDRWTLARAIGPLKGTWFSFTDGLYGTAAYKDDSVIEEYNIGPFETEVPGFNQVLFVTGDCSVYLTTSTDAIGGQYNDDIYDDELRDICSSSESSTPYMARWYNRCSENCIEHKEDPWISTVDHLTAKNVGKIVYGENNYGNFLTQNNGVYVYIRNAGDLDEDGCAIDPCFGIECDNGIYCDGVEYCDNGQCIEGVNVQCEESLICDNAQEMCVADCDSFKIDSYLLECSTEYPLVSDTLRSDVDANIESIEDLYNKMQSVNGWIDSYQSYVPAKGDTQFMDNGINSTSAHLVQYKDIIIIALLLMNIVSMAVMCYMSSKEKKGKYQVVYMDSEDEERALKR